MKNFKKFAIALVAVVLVLMIGLFFKRYWGKMVASWIIWILNSFGVTNHPTDFLNWLNGSETETY